MSCAKPLTFDELVAYWAGDLDPADIDRVELHAMGCDACSAESARVAAVALAVRAIIPPVVTREAVDGFRARGLRVVENTFAPGERRSVRFPSDVDLLIHRLAGFGLPHARRVDMTLRIESSGAVLLQVPDAPFDAHEGTLLIACQQHFRSLPPDTVFELGVIDASGAKRTATYTILHEFEP